LVLIFFTLHRP